MRGLMRHALNRIGDVFWKLIRRLTRPAMLGWGNVAQIRELKAEIERLKVEHARVLNVLRRIVCETHDEAAYEIAVSTLTTIHGGKK